MKKTKVAVLSDIHGVLPKRKDIQIIEGCDIILFCGDVFSRRSFMNIISWWRDLVKMGKRVVFTPGNHDTILYEQYIDEHKEDLLSTYKFDRDVVWFFDDKIKNLQELFKTYGIDCLIDDFVVINDICIYGTPWTPTFCDWAFMGDSKFLKDKYNKIPKGVDILITHGPPTDGKRLFDVPIEYGKLNNHCGSKELYDEILKKSPKYVFFGHIHSGSHRIFKIGETLCANVSYVDESYAPKFKPRVLSL